MITIYVFGGLLLLFLLLTLLAPAQFTLLRTGEVSCSPQQLLKFVSNLDNYSAWNPWLMRDESVQINITGSVAQAGHQLAWKGKKTGAGKIELLSVNENAIEWLIQYERPWKTTGSDQWTIKPTAADKCEITWKHQGRLPWPFARIMGGLIRRNLAYQFETALRNVQEKFAR